MRMKICFLFITCQSLLYRCTKRLGSDKVLVTSWIRNFFRSNEEIEVYVHSDAIIGLAAGTNGVENGIVLISGTGMIGLGVKQHSEPVRAGGWG